MNRGWVVVLDERGKTRLIRIPRPSALERAQFEVEKDELASMQVRERSFLSAFLYYSIKQEPTTDRFTRTGSGQTHGQLKTKRGVFLACRSGLRRAMRAPAQSASKRLPTRASKRTRCASALLC